MMVAVYGNLMVTGIAVALFVATLHLGKCSDSAGQSRDGTGLPVSGRER